MRISPPDVVAYECSFEQAAEIYSQHSLQHCEALPWSAVTLSFQTDSDLMAFKIAFAGSIEFDDEIAITLPDHQDAVECFLAESGMVGRVSRREILWVSFWDTKDQDVFDQEFARA